MEVSHIIMLILILILPFSSLSLSSSPPSMFPSYARPSRSGYLPINASSSSSAPSLFYAFYEAQEPLSPENLSETPLLLWLEGGPGASSMLGNFFHFGPWLISPKDNLTLYPNPYTWNRHVGLLFIDSPLGTGYSVVKDTTEIPHNQLTIASHLLNALQAFLSSNRSFRSRPFYIAGESYGGKFVPSLGYHILQQNNYVLSDLKINLKGVAIGNGLTHPIAQVTTHANSAYFAGIINAEQKRRLECLQLEVVERIIAQEWNDATDLRTEVLSLLKNVTGLATIYDYTRQTDYPLARILGFLNASEVKEAFGVSKDVNFELISNDVLSALHEDIMKSVKFMVEQLVRNIGVLLYQGTYDLQDGVASTEAWVKEMQWEFLEGFLKAERKVWRDDDGLLVGYVQRFGGLSEVVLYGAGHFAAHDKMRNARMMIEGWIMGNGPFWNGDASHGINGN